MVALYLSWIDRSVLVNLVDKFAHSHSIKRRFINFYFTVFYKSWFSQHKYLIICFCVENKYVNSNDILN